MNFSRASRLSSSATEAELIQRSRGGDISAFDLLVKMHERAVFSTAYRLTNSQSDAADIAQEAFVRAWKNLKAFRGDSAFSTWLYRIVTNVFLDERKRAHVRHEQYSLDEQVALADNQVTRQFEDTSPTPQEIAEQQERRAILEKAIASLPGGQRVLVVLYHSQGLSYEEIAEVMQLPMGTVKSRLNRARLALKERLLPLAELFGAAERPT